MASISFVAGNVDKDHVYDEIKDESTCRPTNGEIDFMMLN